MRGHVMGMEAGRASNAGRSLTLVVGGRSGRRRRVIRAAFASAATLIAALGQSTEAANIAWSRNSDNTASNPSFDWNNANSWDLGRVPGAGDVVTINVAKSPVIDFNLGTNAVNISYLKDYET